MVRVNKTNTFGQPFLFETMPGGLKGCFLHIDGYNASPRSHQRSQFYGVVAVARSGIDREVSLSQALLENLVRFLNEPHLGRLLPGDPMPG